MLGVTNVENYVILCFQVSMAFFFNPDLKYLALFFWKCEGDREITCFLKNLFCKVFLKACLAGYVTFSFFALPLKKWLQIPSNSAKPQFSLLILHHLVRVMSCFSMSWLFIVHFMSVTPIGCSEHTSTLLQRSTSSFMMSSFY